MLALSHSHDVLTRTDWTGAQLRGLIVEQLSPFENGDSKRFEVAGPKVLLTSKAAIALGVALGELATNAVKYGALSVENGVVSVTWSRDADAAQPRLRILWRESGGPRVSPPERRGLGTRLIERGVPYELGGVARLVFDPDGLVCEIELPLAKDQR